jgi:N-terminal domain of galactosyltransferase/N-terminal region of glycosyl transferase group 7
MFVVLVPYRARGLQTFRRNEIICMLENVKSYFSARSVDVRFVIAEQNDDGRFNRGLLLNAAFLEAERLYPDAKAYIHMNTDYTIDHTRPFPEEMRNFTSGFLDLHRPAFPVLGAACVFDGASYRTIGGFPNDLLGWGGDDWAIYNRIVRKGVPVHTPEGLFNSGFIIEAREWSGFDASNNDRNVELAKRDDSDTNGVATCAYTVAGHGEFHDTNAVAHYLINTP